MEVLAPSQQAAFHALFDKPYDLMNAREREGAIAAQDSLDLQLLGGMDIIACLLDLMMCVPVCVRLCAWL